MASDTEISELLRSALSRSVRGNGLMKDFFKSPLLSNTEKYIKDTPVKEREAILIQEMKDYPGDALVYASNYMEYISPDKRDELLFEAMKGHQGHALRNVSNYIGFISPGKRDGYLAEVMKLSPGMAMNHISDVAQYLSPENREEIITATVEKTTWGVIPNMAKVMAHISPENHEKVALIAAKNDVPNAFGHVDNYIKYISEDKREGLFVEMAKDNPAYVLKFAKNYMDYISPDKRETLLIEAIKADPEVALKCADNYMEYISPDKREALLIEAAAKNPDGALNYAGSYMDHVSPKKLDELLIKAIEKNPVSALNNAYSYMHILNVSSEEKEELLTKAMKADPEEALVSASKYISYIPEDKQQGFLDQAAKAYIGNLGGIMMISEEVMNALSPEMREKLQEMDDLKDGSLRIGETLNSLHNESDEVRFETLKDMSAADMYTLMIFGRAELYTSSYLGTFERFMDKFEAEGHASLFDVIDPAYESSPVIFLEQAAQFGTLDRALTAMPADKWDDVIEQFASRIENGKLSSTAAFAEIVHKMPNAEIKEKLEEFLKEKYETSPPGNVKDTYGVIISYYNQLSGEEVIPSGDAERYEFSPMDELSKEEVFGDDNIHRQLVVFSEDDDAKSSFENFKKRYENNDKYNFEDKGGYLKITSKEGNLEIYANKPGQSPDLIVDAVVGKKDADVKDANFDSVIHRGHSYNLGNTLPYISPNNKYVFLGSCGGFSNLDEVLDRAPNAQVISTKQTGTMWVNDPALYHINETIRKGGPVEWNKEQVYVDGLADVRREHYVLPHNNIALAIKRKLMGLGMEFEKEMFHGLPRGLLRSLTRSFNDALHEDLRGSIRSFGDEAAIGGSRSLIEEAMRLRAIEVNPELLERLPEDQQQNMQNSNPNADAAIAIMAS